MNHFRILSATVLVFLSAFTLYVFTQPDEIIVQYVPDDAFYYLSIARNIHDGHMPTADGTTHTSGYHPLWGWLLATGPFGPREAGATGAFLALIGLWRLWYLNRNDERSQVAMIFICTATAFAMNIVGGMESGLLILLMVLLEDTGPPKHAALQGVVAAALVLTRIEAVVWVVVAYIHQRTTDTERTHRSLLYGVAFGLLVLFAHNLVVSGDLFSSSVRMKQYWVSMYEPVLLAKRNLNQIADQLFGWSSLQSWGWVLVVGALLVVISDSWTVGVASSLIVAALTRVEWVMPWHMVVLFPLYWTFMWCGAARTSRRWALVVSYIGVSAVFVSVWTLSVNPPYPQNWVMLQAARQVQGKYGAFNSGVLGWYNHNGVENLDGLVNDQIHPYIRLNDVKGYMKMAGIKAVVDNDSTVFGQLARMRGGYPDGLGLKPVHSFGETREFGQVRLWVVEE